MLCLSKEQIINSVFQSNEEENEPRPEYIGKAFTDVTKEFYPHCVIHSQSITGCDPLFMEVIEPDGTLAIKFENFVCVDARLFKDTDE